MRVPAEVLLICQRCLGWHYAERRSSSLSLQFQRHQDDGTKTEVHACQEKEAGYCYSSGNASGEEWLKVLSGRVGSLLGRKRLGPSSGLVWRGINVRLVVERGKDN